MPGREIVNKRADQGQAVLFALACLIGCEHPKADQDEFERDPQQASEENETRKKLPAGPQRASAAGTGNCGIAGSDPC